MRLIKWLLSHLLLITVVVVVGIAAWQHERMSGWYQQALATFHGTRPEVAAPASPPQPAASETSPPTQAAAGGTRQSADDTRAAGPVREASAPEAPSASAEKAPAVPESGAAGGGTDGAAEPGPTSQAPSAAPMSAPASAPSSGGAAAESHSTQAHGPSHGSPAALTGQQRQLLARARGAFWQQDSEAALRNYRQLIGERPDDPDLHGEFGNVLFAVKRLQPAMEQYELAARGLLREHRYAEFDRLARILVSVDPESARQLRAMVQSPTDRKPPGDAHDGDARQ